MDPEHFDPTDLWEWRRMRAWHLKQLGWNQRQIAVALGAREGIVSRGIARSRRDGLAALRSHPAYGRPTKLGLIRHVGSRLLVIWDGSPIHRRAEVQEFLAGAEGRGVHGERLPPDAPDLNPVEGAWQHLKHGELRKMVFLGLKEPHLELHRAIGRLRQKPRLIRLFFEGTRLPMENFPSFCNAQ